MRFFSNNQVMFEKKSSKQVLGASFKIVYEVFWLLTVFHDEEIYFCKTPVDRCSFLYLQKRKVYTFSK